MSGLIQCPSCHKEVSINARVCPYCGEAIRAIVFRAYKKFYIKMSTLPFALILLFGVASYFASEANYRWSLHYIASDYFKQDSATMYTIIAILLWITLIIGVILSFISIRKAFKEARKKILSLIIKK